MVNMAGLGMTVDAVSILSTIASTAAASGAGTAAAAASGAAAAAGAGSGAAAAGSGGAISGAAAGSETGTAALTIFLATGGTGDAASGTRPADFAGASIASVIAAAPATNGAEPGLRGRFSAIDALHQFMLRCTIVLAGPVAALMVQCNKKMLNRAEPAEPIDEARLASARAYPSGKSIEASAAWREVERNDPTSSVRVERSSSEAENVVEISPPKVSRRAHLRFILEG